MSPVNISGFSQLDKIHGRQAKRKLLFCFVLFILQHKILCQSGCINEIFIENLLLASITKETENEKLKK